MMINADDDHHHPTNFNCNRFARTYMLEAEPWKEVEAWNTRIQQESIHPSPQYSQPIDPSLQFPRTTRLIQTMHIHGDKTERNGE